MFRRNKTRTRGQLLRAELGESWDHALRAAGHAAGGVRATVGPRVAPAAGRVRGAAASGWGSTKSALAPLSEAAQHGVKNARKRRTRSRRRWPVVAGLVAGGAAVGGTAAYLVRRRRQQQWEDYQAEPLAPGSEDSLATGAGVGGAPATGSARVGSTPAGSTPASAQSGSSQPGSTGAEPAAGSAVPGSAMGGAGGPDRARTADHPAPARSAESVNAAAARNNRT